MNLAYKYPIIFWDCACLINDAGGNEREEEEDLNLDYEEETYTDSLIEFREYDDEDNEDDEDESSSSKKKKKTRATNYGKIAAAIGKIKTEGASVSPPDINKSTYTFSPDVENNTIKYGLNGITRISEELVQTIIQNRPYTSPNDFMQKVKVNKTQMINLIKSGAFDCFDDRIKIMEDYILKISEPKKRLTLQNMKMLCDFNLLPESLDFEKKVYNFNKYLKKMKVDTYYGLDNVALTFYEQNYDMDNLISYETESGFAIKQTDWDKIYKKAMDPVRAFLKETQQETLEKLNHILYMQMWDKYAQGSLSSWEMQSVSCYFHEHELANIRENLYGISKYSEIPDEPEIEYTFPSKEGKQIPIYRINRIAGTVLDRDKNKKSVTLLTTCGVVVVKIYGEVFSNYDKRISEVGADGKKKIVEESFFKRGNKIIVCGVKTEDGFRGKKYKKTPYHLCELIEEIDDDGTITTRGVRAGSGAA